jgi:hypothetical protein
MRAYRRLVDRTAYRGLAPTVNYSVVYIPIDAPLLVQEVFEDFGMLAIVEFISLAVLGRFDMREDMLLIY